MGRNRDFDDDEFSFDDEFEGGDLRSDAGGDADEFGFDDELGGLGEEEFGEFELPGEGEEFAFEEEQVAERPRTSRTFILLAAAMIILFVVGLIAVLILATRPPTLSQSALAATTVVAQNMTQEFFATQTAIANATFSFGQTQTALVPPTPTPTLTPTPTETPTQPVAPPTLNPTDVAATQVIEGLTQTAIASAQVTQVTPTVPVTRGPLTAEDVAMTATALAGLFLITPTAEIGTPIGGGTPVPTAAILPETGLIDDLVAGAAQGLARWS
jgi:hypothetical protein